MLLNIVGSKVRYAVLIILAKAWRLGIPVTPRSIARVFGVNLAETYGFMGKLAEEGMVNRVRGGYVLTDKGSKLVDFVLEAIPRLNDGFDSLRTSLPDTMYYVFTPPFQSWFGVSRPLVIVDRRLRGLVDMDNSGFIVIYTSMRGREYKYNWDTFLPHPSIEQGYADVVSYDPEWLSYIPDILLNLERLDLDKLLDKATGEGARRIASALAFYETLTGKRKLLKKYLYSLVCGELVKEIASFTIPLLVDSRVVEAKNL